MGALPRRGVVHASLFAFAAALFATLVVGTAFEESAASRLVLGDADAVAGYRRVDGHGAGTVLERVVSVHVPYAWSGDVAARYVLTLFVADDAAFDYPVGVGSHEIAASPDAPSGRVLLEVRVPSGGTFHWELSASPLAGADAAPVPLTGAVTFHHRTR